MPKQSGPPRIQSVRIKNSRALRDVEITFKPFTVLLDANGSGKSTLLDVFAFLAECFNQGLRKALDKRGRLRELLSREADGRWRLNSATGNAPEPGSRRIT